MNRREALQAGLGVLSALSIDGEVATLSPRNPQAFILSSQKNISVEAEHQIRRVWSEIFAGTEMSGVPLIILGGGMKLEVIDKLEEIH